MMYYLPYNLCSLLCVYLLNYSILNTGIRRLFTVILLVNSFIDLSFYLLYYYNYHKSQQPGDTFEQFVITGVLLYVISFTRQLTVWGLLKLAHPTDDIFARRREILQ